MALLPDDVFKRRRNHNNTPESVLLIIVNYIVISIACTLFTDSTHINWFFWVVLGLLGVYNFFNVRRNIHEYNKTTTIAYVSSTIVLVIVFFLFKGKL